MTKKMKMKTRIARQISAGLGLVLCIGLFAACGSVRKSTEPGRQMTTLVRDTLSPEVGLSRMVMPPSDTSPEPVPETDEPLFVPQP